MTEKASQTPLSHDTGQCSCFSIVIHNKNLLKLVLLNTNSQCLKKHPQGKTKKGSFTLTYFKASTAVSDFVFFVSLSYGSGKGLSG